MTTTHDQVHCDAWPFLVGRGLRVGHRVIAAPRFLVDSPQLRILESGEIEPRDAEAKVTSFPSAEGKLTIVSSTLRVTGDVVGDPSGADRPVLDMHSRPLEMLYGFVVAGHSIRNIADKDLGRSRHVAVDAYRRFLADEERPEIETTNAFAVVAHVEKVEVVEPKSKRVVAPDPEPRQSALRPRGRVLVGAALIILGALFFLLRPGAGSGDLQIVSDTEECRRLTADAPGCVVTLRSSAERSLDVRILPPDSYRVDGCNGSLAPGAQCSVRIVATSAAQAELRIEHGGEGSPLVIELDRAS